MKKIVTVMILLFGSLLIAACGQVPLEEGCDHMDQNITVEGYLDFDYCYLVIVDGIRQKCSLWLYEQSDQQGQRLWIVLDPKVQPIGSLEGQLQEICADNPACSLNSTSQFSISGHIAPNKSNYVDDVCVLVVNDIKDIGYKP